MRVASRLAERLNPLTVNVPHHIETSQKTLEKNKCTISRSVLFHMKATVSLKYFVNDCRK